MAKTPSKSPAGAKAARRKAPAEARKAAVISITDVARHAEVSIGTVSRVINRHPSVSPDLRRRVLSSSRSLGFSPKVAHRSIAVITGRHSPALPVGYVGVMTSLVSRFLATKRCLVELIDIENLDMAYETHLDGVIGVVFDDRLAALKSIPNLPVLSINKPLTQENVHSVYADHYQQGAIATRHLIERGHRHIGFLETEADVWGCKERLRGYKDVLAEHALPIEPSLIQYTTEQPVYNTLARWNRRGVSAILNFSEDTCLEVLHILTNVLDLTIGRDISTVTIEDLPIYQYISPPQTVVRQPLEEMARIAVDFMTQACDSPTAPACLDCCLPTELIEHDSVATLG